MKNSTVYVPLNTVRLKLRSGNLADGGRDERLTGIEVKLRDYERLTDTLQQVRNVLMITPSRDRGFRFRTQEEWAENVTRFVHNARVNGAMISGISLLVGGIGIMNIMLASHLRSASGRSACAKAVGAARATSSFRF